MLAVLPFHNTQVLLLLMCALGCSNDQIDQSVQEPTRISAWFHAANDREEELIQEQVTRFNTRQDTMTVKLTVFQEEEYHNRIENAIRSGNLPDILEFDGQHMYEYAGNGVLLPLEEYLPADLIGNLLPSAYEQGTYLGNLYSVATTDSALSLYADRREPEEVNVRTASSLNQWSIGITTICDAPDAAAQFLSYLLTTDESLRISQERGTSPLIRQAIENSPLYGEKGPLQLSPTNSLRATQSLDR